MEQIDIKGIDKAVLLRALYAFARPQGLGHSHFMQGPLPMDEARSLVERFGPHGLRFDYLHGRVIKCSLAGDTMRGYAFDRDNGEGAAASAVQEARDGLHDE